MNSKEFEEACQNAAKEFFRKELRIQNVNVTESKLSQTNKSCILWVKIGDQNRLKCLNSVAVLSKSKQLDPTVKLITKIPNQFWSRNKSLESNCQHERQNNPNLRYQIRLGQVDLELQTKSKNDLYWQVTPLEAFGPLEPIQTTSILKTPEGRGPKRAANSPLTNEVKKNQHWGSVPKSNLKT